MAVVADFEMEDLLPPSGDGGRSVAALTQTYMDISVEQIDDMSEFVWSFPCYLIIGANEKGLAFGAPNGNLAVFTDSDLALSYCATHHPTFSPVKLDTRAIATGVIRSVANQFSHIGVDPHPDPQRKSLRMPIPNALQSLRAE